jgi:activator of HSP90 ATPase
VSENQKPTLLGNPSTRRQLMSGAAIIFGSLAVGSKVWGRAQQAMKENPSSATLTRTSLHQESSFRGSAQRLYEVLLSSKQFTAFSGAPAEIDATAGGAFSMFGGLIVGRNVELVPTQRIVQAWRPTHWNPGIYSIVRFDLKPDGPQTLIVLDHTGFPEGEFDNLAHGWKSHYWEPLAKFLK